MNDQKHRRQRHSLWAPSLIERLLAQYFPRGRGYVLPQVDAPWSVWVASEFKVSSRDELVEEVYDGVEKLGPVLTDGDGDALDEAIDARLNSIIEGIHKDLKFKEEELGHLNRDGQKSAMNLSQQVTSLRREKKLLMAEQRELRIRLGLPVSDDTEHLAVARRFNLTPDADEPILSPRIPARTTGAEPTPNSLAVPDVRAPKPGASDPSDEPQGKGASDDEPPK